MDDFFALIYGLRVASGLCEHHNEPEAEMAVQFAMDWFGANEDDVREYIEWSSEDELSALAELEDDNE